MNLYVHEEISIPKPSPLAANGYKGTVNNIDLTNKSLLVDRTNSSKDVVHIMLTKPTVMDIAQKIVENNSNIPNNQSKTTEMTFTLSPSKNTITGNMNSSSMNMPMNGSM